MATEAIRHASQSSTVLLVDPLNSSGHVQRELRAAGHKLFEVPLSRPISGQLRSMLFNIDVVLLDVTTSSHEISKAAQDLASAMLVCGSRARLLCFSAAHRNPNFVVGLEKFGARYVRISNLGMLLEAIDLLLAREAEFQHNGPCFRIIHRFSKGFCAPGEEISAIQFARDGDLFQLPLGLAERLVFNFAAQHRQIALDSSQIISGLNDWFYREHARNSGVRQVPKIRVATVKVIAQRVRKAMASTFTRAHVNFDPFDVLRSFPAESSKKVLYKLRADIHWDHPSH